MREVTMYLRLDEIVVPDGRRETEPETVERLAASIREIGLQHPITVRSHQDQFILIAGAHRLEAMRKLEESHIRATIAKFDAIDAEMWEISENLHRAELTELERKTQIGRWIQLKRQKLGEGREEVFVPTAQKHRGGRPEGGISAAARELGVERSEASRSVQVAKMAPEVREAIRQHGLADAKRAIREIASTEPEHQLEKVAELTPDKSAGGKSSNGGGGARIDHAAAARTAATFIAEAISGDDLQTLKQALASTTTKAVLAELSNFEVAF
jgi:ParB family transcriptional regulator, chromosome partitioning protein